MNFHLLVDLVIFIQNLLLSISLQYANINIEESFNPIKEQIINKCFRFCVNKLNTEIHKDGTIELTTGKSRRYWKTLNKQIAFNEYNPIYKIR